MGLGLILKATVTTAADGSATVYVGNPVASTGAVSSTSATTLSPVSGAWSVESITYVKTDYADGVDFTITEQETGIALWTGTNVNAAITVYPRAFVSDAATGTASTSVYDLIRLINSTIKIVIAAGGNTKTGAFYFKLSE